MLAIFIYFLLSSSIFLAQKLFLFSRLEQLHELGLQLPLFILINNFIILLCLVKCVEEINKKWGKLRQRERKRWLALLLASGAVSLAFSFINTSFYSPAIFKVIYVSSGNTLNSAIITAVIILLSAFILALTRLCVLMLGGITTAKKAWARTVQTLVLLPFLHLAELTLLLTFPILYTIGFQLPVAFKKNLVEESHKSLTIAPMHRTVYLFNPNITYRIRQQVFFTSGSEGFESAGKLLGIEIRSALDKHKSKLVTVILPEVTIYAKQEDQVKAFAHSAIAEINKKLGVSVDFLFGVQLKGKNLILYQQGQGDRSNLGLVREKFLLIPFFEKRTFGIDLGEPEAKKNQQINLPILNPKQLPPYARPEAFDICYESLYLQRWQFGKPKLVLANYAAFYDSLSISKAYDITLQTLGVAFRSPLVLASNRGLTGVFVDEKDMARLNQFFNSPEGKQVRFLRVVGF